MITTEALDDVLLVRVNSARLDSAVGTLVRNTVMSALANQKKFIIDVNEVKLVDSGGLGTLVALLKTITANQGRLALAGMQKSVKMMFELSRMDKQFTLLDDVSSALSALQ